jgi:hypothetical protein
VDVVAVVAGAVLAQALPQEITEDVTRMTEGIREESIAPARAAEGDRAVIQGEGVEAEAEALRRRLMETI